MTKLEFLEKAVLSLASNPGYYDTESCVLYTRSIVLDAFKLVEELDHFDFEWK